MLTIIAKIVKKNNLQSGNLTLPLLLTMGVLAVILPLTTNFIQKKQILKNNAEGQLTSFNITVWDESTQRRWGTGNDCSNQKGVSLSTTLGSIVFTQDEIGGHFDVVNLPLGQTLTITLNPPVSCGYSCGNWTLIKRSADLSSFEVVKTGSGCQITLAPETQQWRTGLQFNLARQPSSPTPIPSQTPTTTPNPSPTPTPTPTLIPSPTPTLLPTQSPIPTSTITPHITFTPTLTATPTSTPVSLSLKCLNLETEGEIKPNSTIKLTCTAESPNSPIQEFRFRSIYNQKILTDLGPADEIISNGNQGIKTVTLSQSGCYTFECQACNQYFCTPWTSN